MVTYRRLSWTTVVVAAAISICLPQWLDAQTASTSQPAAAPAPSGQLKTLAVVAGARYEKLISDITFLGPLVGKPQAGQLAEAIVNQFTMGKAATAIDKTKPWGIIVQTDGAKFYPVACLPIVKPDEVLDVAKAYGADVKDGENGTKELALPNRPPLFMKSQDNVVFISSAAASLSRLPANPSEILTKMVADYDLSAAIAVKNVPEMYRQFVIGALQAGIQQGLKREPGETDAQFAQRQQLMQAQVSHATELINEVDTVKVGWAVDAQQRQTYFDFMYQFLPDSKMAKQMSAYSQPHTNFAGFYQPDAAATATISTKADPKLIANDMSQIESAMRNAREQVDRQIDNNDKIGNPQVRDALKSAVHDLFDAIEATAKEGEMDGGASLRVSPDSLTFVAGIHVKDPSKVESALKKLESAAKNEPNAPAIKWNAASHAGVKFDTITIPVPSNEEGPRRMFGENVNVAIGIGSESAYLAIGRDNIDAVNKAIDASAASPDKAVPPFEFSLSVGPIMDFAAEVENDPQKKEMCRAMADELKNKAAGRDHVRVVGQIIPNGLRYRIEAEDGVIRLIGVAAAHQQARMRGGNN